MPCLDYLSQFADRDNYLNSLEGYISGVNSVLELYRASQIMTLPSEVVLEKLNSWTSNFLKNEVSNDESRAHKKCLKEVCFLTQSKVDCECMGKHCLVKLCMVSGCLSLWGNLL